MLTLADLRKLIDNSGGDPKGEPSLADDDLDRIRTALYALAHITLDLHQRDREFRRSAFSVLPEDELDEVEERAAITEFEAGRRREEAERIAMHRLLDRKSHAKKSAIIT